MESTHADRKLYCSGFTLLELALVLVVIGLLVGGVVVGRDMIRNAELNSIASDVDKFRSAINSFKYKYGQIPGDFTRSSAYWPASCSPTPTLCDGNGNGTIDNDLDNLRFWGQLSLARLVPGTYPYLTAAQFAPNLIIPPEERYRPATRLPGGAYWVYSEMLDGVRRNALGVGGAVRLSHNIDPFVSGLEAFSLDTKVDDGNIETGNLRSVEPGSYVGSFDPSGSCATDSDDAGCSLFFLGVM